MDWIDLTQNRDMVRERIFGLHKTRGISWADEELLASQEGIFSLELVYGEGYKLIETERVGPW